MIGDGQMWDINRVRCCNCSSTSVCVIIDKATLGYHCLDYSIVHYITTHVNSPAKGRCWIVHKCTVCNRDISISKVYCSPSYITTDDAVIIKFWIADCEHHAATVIEPPPHVHSSPFVAITRQFGPISARYRVSSEYTWQCIDGNVWMLNKRSHLVIFKSALLNCDEGITDIQCLCAVSKQRVSDFCYIDIFDS